MKEQPKCAHEPCSCTAREFNDYCCEECECQAEAQRDGSGEPAPCRCGHDGCMAEPLPLEAAEALRLATEALAGA